MGDQWGLDKEATIFRGLHPAQGTRQEWEGREGGGIGTAGDSKPFQAAEKGQNEQGWDGWGQRKTVSYSGRTLESWSVCQIFRVG